MCPTVMVQILSNVSNKEPKKDGREYTELRVNKRVLEIVDSPTFNVNMMKNSTKSPMMIIGFVLGVTLANIHDAFNLSH